MVNDVLREAEGRMKKTAEALRHTLISIRTGRASISLVENIRRYASTQSARYHINTGCPHHRHPTV